MNEYVLIIRREAGDAVDTVISTDLAWLQQLALTAGNEMNSPSFPGRVPKHRATSIRILEVKRHVFEWIRPVAENNPF